MGSCGCLASTNVLEDRGDDIGIFDAGDDSQRATALGAGLDVDGEDAFVALRDVPLDDILCLKEERTVTRNNCISYRGLPLQLRVGHGRNYVKRQVRVYEHADGQLSVFHGPRRLARYDADGVAARALAAA